LSRQNGLPRLSTITTIRRLHNAYERGENKGCPTCTAQSGVSSGSFRTDGMIIAPCSMKTLAAIRSGYGDTLICRAADVILKERRKLVLLARESPLNEIHLENMLALARMGVTIFPPVPAFYNRPETIGELVDYIVGRVLDQFGLEMPGLSRWVGLRTDS